MRALQIRSVELVLHSRQQVQVPHVQSLTLAKYRCQKVPVPRIESQELVLRRYHQVRGHVFTRWCCWSNILDHWGRRCKGDRRHWCHMSNRCLRCCGVQQQVSDPCILIAGDSSTVWRWNQHSAGASVRPSGPFALCATRMKALRFRRERCR